MAEITLEQFCSAVGTAVQQAQQSVEYHACQSYWQYFEPLPSANDAENEAIYAPKCRKIRLPGIAERELQVPLLSLVNHASMSLEQVKVRVKVKAKSLPDAGLKVEIGPLGPQDAPCEANAVEGDAAENSIELTFKKALPTEGISRILQEAVKFL